MAAYIPVPCWQIELISLWDSQTVESVLHFTAPSGPTVTDLNNLGLALVNWWTTNIKPNMPTTLQLSDIRMTDLSSQTGQVFDYATGMPVVGTSASPSLPNSVACVFTKRTAQRGRSYRGRIYQYGLTEAAVTNNLLAGSNVSGYITAYNLLRSFSTATMTWTFVVASRYNNGAPRTTGVATPVVNITSDGVIDSQRRRLPGRGA